MVRWFEIHVMRLSYVISLVLLAFIAGLVVGGISGSRSASFGLAINENKMAAANLAADRNFYGSTNLSAEFREYLKARIYHNVFKYYPRTKGYLLQKDWDFGPVDRQLLTNRHILVWKDIDEVIWDWNSAVTNK
jgi:hypothetical protein